MKIEKLNNLAMLLANIGVIAGIIFLALEVRQNTTMMRAATRDSMTQQLTNWQLTVASNPKTAIIYQKGNGGFAGLEQDQAENITYGLLANSIFRIWENEWYQYQLGLYEEEEFTPRLARWERNIRGSTGYRDMWLRSREQFSSGFQNIIDGFIE